MQVVDNQTFDEDGMKEFNQKVFRPFEDAIMSRRPVAELLAMYKKNRAIFEQYAYYWTEAFDFILTAIESVSLDNVIFIESFLRRFTTFTETHTDVAEEILEEDLDEDMLSEARDIRDYIDEQRAIAAEQMEDE